MKGFYQIDEKCFAHGTRMELNGWVGGGGRGYDGSGG